MVAREPRSIDSTMVVPKSELVRAFEEDHALLGRGFHELSTALRAADLAAARRLAAHLDQEAGAHIAFEEVVFYPRLGEILGVNEVEALQHQHTSGLAVVDRLCRTPPDAEIAASAWREMLRQSEEMEGHIAECGELFEAMGRISDEEQTVLTDALVAWRRKRPSWRVFAETAQSAKIE